MCFRERLDSLGSPQEQNEVWRILLDRKILWSDGRKCKAKKLGGLGVLWLCAAFQISCSGQAEMFPTVLQLTAGLESSGVCGP